MKKIRILMIIGSLDYCNGITSYAMNYYNELIKKDFEIDFAVHYEFSTEYSEKILKDQNHVFYMGNYSLKSMLGLNKRIRKLLDTNHYDIIHCHILNLAYFYFKQAKKHKIYCRILHSHATKNSDNPIKNFRNSLFKFLANRYTTDRFACSKLAGDYLFGEKPYRVIKNAINYDKFKFSIEFRDELKNKYLIVDECCLGFIGRFTAQKNILFLISIAKDLMNLQFKFKLFLIGDGNLYSDIIQQIEINKLSSHIIVINSTPDVYKYYSLFDYFVLPSLFEGLPVTGVEAQIAGCHCLLSDKITKELNFTGNCTYLPITNSKEWANYINENTAKRELVISDEYNIKVESENLASLYARLVEGGKNV